MGPPRVLSPLRGFVGGNPRSPGLAPRAKYLPPLSASSFGLRRDRPGLITKSGQDTRCDGHAFAPPRSERNYGMLEKNRRSPRLVCSRLRCGWSFHGARGVPSGAARSAVRPGRPHHKFIENFLWCGHLARTLTRRSAKTTENRFSQRIRRGAKNALQSTDSRTLTALRNPCFEALCVFKQGFLREGGRGLGAGHQGIGADTPHISSANTT